MGSAVRKWLALAGLVLALHLFASGFLLRRPVLPHIATADQQQQPRQLKRYDRLVWVLIDALRHDFAVMQPPSASAADHYFANKLPVLNETLARHPDHTMLLRFEADAPTTTLQRIKGFTTGSLPTFIDIGSSFSSSAIEEDNLILQLGRQGTRKTVFLGDDTWMSCFPDAFDTAHPFPSFNVWDLHTVDNGIMDHIDRYVVDDGTDGTAAADVVIAHFLGVDHCGHRYGSDHPAMAEKLTQMNNVLAHLIERLPQRTLLVVAGDHGMTTSGDHGGDSALETGAALFLYATGPALKGSLGLDRSDIDSEIYMRQIDLVPTLSVLMGVPIPFGSLGMVLPTVFPDWPSLLAALEQNVNQVESLLIALDHAGLDMHGPAWEPVWSVLTEYRQERSANSAVRFLRAALEQCMRMWARFDTWLMSLGVLLCLAVVGVCLATPAAFDDFSPGQGVALLLCLAHLAMMGSNSFIVYEDQINVFLLVSAATVVAYKARSYTAAVAAVVFAACVRMSAATKLCRDEQEACVGTYSELHYSLAESLLWLAAMSTIQTLYCQRRGDSVALSSKRWFNWIGPLSAVFTGMYWWSIGAGSSQTDASLILARCIYAFIVIGFLQHSLSSHKQRDPLVVPSILLSLMTLLNGPAAVAGVSLVSIAFIALTVVFSSHQDNRGMSDLHLVLVSLLADRFFFATGHQATFSTIRWAPGFIGIQDMHFVLSGALVTSAYFAGPILAGSGAVAVRNDGALRFTGVQSVRLLANMITVFHLRRHLMVWKIFAPRFIYQAFASCFGSIAGTVLGFPTY